MKPNLKADGKNANGKTPGTNRTYKAVHDQRSRQIKENKERGK